MEKLIKEKSEILFLYETSYNIPNGDPFTGEQRYDEETKKVLVSDVRIKRFVRTYLEGKGEKIYVSDKTGAEKKDAKGVLTWLIQNQKTEEGKAVETDVEKILKQQIDVRLFGGISTLKEHIKVNGKDTTNEHVQLTGPVQFSLLNPSLNRVNLKMHQNTSHFTSKDTNSQGAIGTTTIVPYSVVQIHGWTNPKIAKTTDMTEEDKIKLFEGMWYGTSGEGSSFSRSKVGQDSLLLLELVYKEENKKVYGVDRLITIKLKDNNKKEEQLRSIDDFDFDFSKLAKVVASNKIAKLKYYTEIEEIKNALTTSIKEKIEFMQL